MQAEVIWEERRREKQGNYILALREGSGDKRIETFINPTREGNVGRFISEGHLLASSLYLLLVSVALISNLDHACPPSTNLIIIPIRAVGSTRPVAALFAAKDIAANEELSFDYSDAGGDIWLYNDAAPLVNDDQIASNNDQRTICLCDSVKSVHSTLFLFSCNSFAFVASGAEDSCPSIGDHLLLPPDQVL